MKKFFGIFFEVFNKYTLMTISFGSLTIWDMYNEGDPIKIVGSSVVTFVFMAADWLSSDIKKSN